VFGDLPAIRRHDLGETAAAALHNLGGVARIAGESRAGLGVVQDVLGRALEVVPQVRLDRRVLHHGMNRAQFPRHVHHLRRVDVDEILVLLVVVSTNGRRSVGLRRDGSIRSLARGREDGNNALPVPARDERGRRIERRARDRPAEVVHVPEAPLLGVRAVEALEARANHLGVALLEPLVEIRHGVRELGRLPVRS